MNIRRTVVALALSAAMLTGVGSAVNAAPGDNGNGYGGCVDILYGNASNPRPSGNGTLPSQAPGPFVNADYGLPMNERERGLTVGDVMKGAREYGLNGKETMQVICTFQ